MFKKENNNLLIMLTLTEIFLILIVHWIADFVLQTDKQARGKSKNWSDLLNHTFTYSLVFGIVMLFLLSITKPNIGIYLPSIFFSITLICHTITDYFTSRLNSKLWYQATFWQNSFNKEKYGEAYCNSMTGKYTHYFFVSVGFDQILHYVQLFLTYYLLKQ